jgi:hypothetical protein
MLDRFSVQVSTASPDHAMAVMVAHFSATVATVRVAVTVATPDELVMVAMAVPVSPEPRAPRA